MPEQSVRVLIYTPEAEYEHKLIIPHIETSTISLLSLVYHGTLYRIQYIHIYTRVQTQTQTARTIWLPNTIGFLFHAFSTMIHIRMLLWKCCWLHRVHRLPNGWRTIHIYIDQKKAIWKQTHRNHLIVVSQEIPSHQRKKM